MGLCLSAGSPPLEAAPAARSSGTAIAVDVPELTVQELQKATGSFSPSRQIGKGRFATVYWASMQNGRIAAAKRLDPPRTSGHWDAVTVLRRQDSHHGQPCHSRKRYLQLRSGASRASDRKVGVARVGRQHQSKPS
ncbi:hypothetical protein EJB05_22183, partial [Eragrostis curvula]